MRRSEAARLVPNADEGAGLCPFVIPKKGSTRSGVTAGMAFLPDAPDLGAGAGLVRDAVPSVALAGLLGALAAAVAGRRRRWGGASVA